jgi:hypothetical protein
LNVILDDLDSVVIVTRTGEIRLRSEKEMRDYLLPKRKGMDKGRIEIVLQ